MFGCLVLGRRPDAFSPRPLECVGTLPCAAGSRAAAPASPVLACWDATQRSAHKKFWAALRRSPYLPLFSSLAGEGVTETSSLRRSFLYIGAFSPCGGR